MTSLKDEVRGKHCTTAKTLSRVTHTSTTDNSLLVVPESNSSDGSTTTVPKRPDLEVKEYSVAEIKLPSYVSISCAINGYTSYGRFCRSRDNSPARFPLSSSPLKNWEPTHHLNSCNSSLKSTVDHISKEHNGSISYKESREVFIGKQLEIPFVNGNLAQIDIDKIDRTNGTMCDSTDRAVNGHDDEKGILLETLKEFGDATSKHKSLVLQRIESLYGPSSEEVCKVLPRKSRLIEPTSKSISLTKRSPSCPPQVIRNQSQSPPVFRRLTKDFREQLRENDTVSHNGIKDIKEKTDVSGKKIPTQTNLSQIISLPISPKNITQKDGHWFISLMEEEKCIIMDKIIVTEKYLNNSNIPEDVCGKIRSAIGKANLLLSQKFEQFRQLCEKNTTQTINEPVPTSSDLAGFWDLVLLQVSDVKNTFDEINKLKENNWKEILSPEKSQSRPKFRKQITPGISKSNPSTPNRSSKSAELAKAREQARKQLMEAKRRGRQQNATQDSDTEIAIFIPQNSNTH